MRNTPMLVGGVAVLFATAGCSQPPTGVAAAAEAMGATDLMATTRPRSLSRCRKTESWWTATATIRLRATIRAIRHAGPRYGQQLLDIIQQLNPNPVRIAPMHGRVVPFDNLRIAVTAATTT